MPDTEKRTKTITLVWTDATAETYGHPKLDLHVDGVNTWEEMDQILRLASKCAEARLAMPEFALFTKDYDDAQKGEKKPNA